MKSIQEFLVNKPLKKVSSYNFPIDKEIIIDNIKNVSHILKKILNENDFIKTYWYSTTRKTKNAKPELIEFLGIVDSNNNYPLYNVQCGAVTDYSTVIHCKIIYDVRRNIFIEDSDLDIDEQVKIKYCSKEECTQLEKGREKYNIKL